MIWNKNKIYESILLLSLSGLCIFSILILRPTIDPSSDSPSYLQAMDVLRSGPMPENFMPNRILTTFAGLETVSAVGLIFRDTVFAWFLVNTVLYFALGIVFYKLLGGLFKSSKAAFLGTLFLAGNYAILNFGLGFYMDIGGWAFYIFALYFLYLYSESKNYKTLLLAALMVGIGGLWKEYAFLGAIPIMCFLVYENWSNLREAFKKGFLPAMIVLLPTAILHFFVYQKFGYTYFDWLHQNQNHYIYSSRTVEYIKSFGSLINFLGAPFILGTYIFLKEGKDMVQEKKNLILIISALVSVLPILFWPAITQRILFIAVPGIIMISSFAFKKYEKYWYLFLILLVVYIITNFAMDPLILPYVNLPF